MANPFLTLLFLWICPRGTSILDFSHITPTPTRLLMKVINKFLLAMSNSLLSNGLTLNLSATSDMNDLSVHCNRLSFLRCHDLLLSWLSPCFPATLSASLSHVWPLSSTETLQSFIHSPLVFSLYTLWRMWGWSVIIYEYCIWSGYWGSYCIGLVECLLH